MSTTTTKDDTLVINGDVGQIAYEAFQGALDEAADWAGLSVAEQRRWANTARAVLRATFYRTPTA